VRFPKLSIRPRRRWFQFSLRSLFLLTLLVALGLGGFMTEFRRARSQTEAVEAIIASGGTVGYRYVFGGSDSRSRFGQSRFETQRRPLASLFGEGFLAYVVVADFVPADDLMDHGACRTVDADLVPLERLPYVESLNLYHAIQVTDAGLKHLEHSTRMRVLNLELTSMTDTGLKSLGAMSQLEELSLTYPRMPGRGLELLRQFGGLRKMILGPWIADADLRQLKYLTGLRQLSLTGMGITDAGLEQLKGLTQLKQLDITGTRVTPAGVRRLRDALPKCEVDWTAPSTTQFPGWRTRRKEGGNEVTKDKAEKDDTVVIPLLPEKRRWGGDLDNEHTTVIPLLPGMHN
jgi:hypothetical protein